MNCHRCFVRKKLSKRLFLSDVAAGVNVCEREVEREREREKGGGGR